MAKLEYYADSDKKSEKFYYHIIDTKKDFDELYKNLNDQFKNQKNNDLIYRGCNNATFKLYNSAQRHWIREGLAKWGIDFHNFIKQEINNAKSWQNGLLFKFYNSFGHSTAYDLAVLSFLQHYKAPTPLLDWSYSLDNSLFFAIDGIKHYESDGLENYCSVYIISKGQNHNELLNYADLHEQAKLKLEELKQKHPEADSSDLDKKYKEYSYDLIKDTSLVYISDIENNSKPLMYTNTNFNIINQEGLFIFNNHPTRPLEYLFKGKDNVEEGDTFHLTKITCVDINKNLTNHIRDFLNSKGVNNKFIYPQEEDLAWNSFLEFLK